MIKQVTQSSPSAQSSCSSWPALSTSTFWNEEAAATIDSDVMTPPGDSWKSPLEEVALDDDDPFDDAEDDDFDDDDDDDLFDDDDDEDLFDDDDDEDDFDRFDTDDDD